MKSAKRDLLKGLNAQQLEAVQTLDTSLLVVAGAGTGKTRVLTTRIANLVRQKKARPEEIMAVTFTNKAAAELRDRLKALIGPGAERIRCGTFHALSLQIMRFHSLELGFINDNITIIDEDEQDELLHALISRKLNDGLTVDRKLARSTRRRIAQWKEAGLTPEAVTDKLRTGEIAGSPGIARAAEAYRIYQRDLKARNLCDLGDLVFQVVDFLESNATARDFWRDQIRYLLVDELQDANDLQYRWLKALTGDKGNICGVGDTRQSIYEWRHARPELMVEFPEIWPNARVVPITQNYRSTRQILGVANRVIAKLSDFAGSELVSQTDGPEVEHLPFRSDIEETGAIADMISQEISQGRSAEEIAVLYRTNQPMPAMRDALKQRGIGSIMLGGQPLTAHEEVRDLVAYMRLSLNPFDAVAFMRISERPDRRIGQRLSELASEIAFAEGTTLSDGCRLLAADKREAVSPKQQAALLDLAHLLDDIHFTALRTQRPADVLGEVLERTGYRDWRVGEEVERRDQIDTNLTRLLHFARESDHDVRDFLASIAFTDHSDIRDPGKVVLSTMHSVKGLEFDVVFTPLMVEGVAPHANAVSEHGDPAEERRLIHVAWTRARQRLITSAPSVVRFAAAQPSRYLADAELIAPSSIDNSEKVSKRILKPSRLRLKSRVLA